MSLTIVDQAGVESVKNVKSMKTDLNTLHNSILPSKIMCVVCVCSAYVCRQPGIIALARLLWNKM